MSCKSDLSILQHLQELTSLLYEPEDSFFSVDGLSEKELATLIYQYYQDVCRKRKHNDSPFQNESLKSDKYGFEEVEVLDVFPFLQLPQTVSRIVLGFLDFEDKKNLRLVSKEYENHVTSLCKALRQWSITFNGEMFGEDIIGLLNAKKKHQMSPQHLEIEFVIHDFHKFLDINVKRLLYTDWGEYITNLRIWVSENELINQDLQFDLPNLKSLVLCDEFNDCKIDVVQKVLENIFKKNSRTLEHLELVNFRSDSCYSWTRSLNLAGAAGMKLKTLKLAHNNAFVNQPIFHSNKDTITTLEIDETFSDDKDYSGFIGDYCPKIKHILLDGVKVYDSFSPILTSHNCAAVNKLETLKIVKCGGGQDLKQDLSPGSGEIQFSKLKRLWIDEEFLWLLPRCSNSVEYLYLDVETEDTTYAIKLTNLKELFISKNCSIRFLEKFLEQNLDTIEVIIVFETFLPSDICVLLERMTKLEVKEVKVIVSCFTDDAETRFYSKPKNVKVCGYRSLMPGLNTKHTNYKECPSFWNHLHFDYY